MGDVTKVEKKKLYSSNQPGTKGDKKYWAIARGKMNGVVVGWDRVEPQVTGCKKPVCYRSFNTEQEAWTWLTDARRKLQRKLHKTRRVTKTRPIPGKKGEEEEYETDEVFLLISLFFSSSSISFLFQFISFQFHHYIFSNST
jgi:hypothetical protein